MPRKMIILVEVKNELLGDSVFWEGKAEDIETTKGIMNKVALSLAKRVIAQGPNAIANLGMWQVSVREDK